MAVPPAKASHQGEAIELQGVDHCLELTHLGVQ
jgi:hypothetical protein